MHTDPNDITFIRNMNFKTMLALWQTMRPDHPFITNPTLWGEFETRRKELCNKEISYD